MKMTTCTLRLVVLASLLQGGDGHAEELLPLDTVFNEPKTYAYELSPDSRHLAGHLAIDGEPCLVLMDTQGSEPQVLINFGQMDGVRLNKYEWIDNDSLYIDFANRGDAERLAFIHVEMQDGVATGTIEFVSDDGTILDALPGQENTVFFAREVNDDDEARYRLYTLTVDQLVRGNYRQGREFGNRLMGAVHYRLDSGSGKLLASTLDGEQMTHWFLDSDSDKWVAYFEHNERDYQVVPIGLLGNGRLAVLTNESTDLMSLTEFDLETRTFGETLYQHERYDVIDAEISPATRRPRHIRYVNHGLVVTEYFVDSESRVSRLIAGMFPGKQVQIVSGDESSTKKVLWVSASNDPGMFYLLDTETSELEILTPRFADLANYELTKSEVFTVQANGGQEIEAIITRANAPNGVLLVNPHGGPVGIRDLATYNPETQFLANRGYTVLNVNFRGSWGYGKKFLDTGRGQFGQGIEDDISSVVDDLLTRESYARVCSIGTSYGGYSAMMLAIRNPDLYECVVAMFGIYDLPLVFNTSNFALLEQNRRNLEHVIGEYSDELADVSPLYLAESLQAPVLLIAGSADRVADYEHSNRMKYRLQQLGKPVEYLFYPGVGHGHRTWKGDRHQYALVDDFIRRRLELPLPAVSNQAEVIGDSYYKLATFYGGSKYEDHDNELVLSYLRKSAELENAPALYWLGTIYEDGIDILPSNIEVAVQHYWQASELGHDDASYRLAELYRDGNLTDENNGARSFELFSRAFEQGNVMARYDMAAAYCTANGVERDLDQCLALLAADPDKRKNTSRTRRKRDHILAMLAWDDSMPAVVKSRIIEYIRDETSSHYKSVGIVGLQSGVRDENGYYRNWRVPMVIGTRFGVRFRVHRGRTDGGSDDGYVVKVRWTAPPGAKDGTDFREERIRRLNYLGMNTLTYRLEFDWELTPGAWRLQVLTLDDEVLIDEIYETDT